MRKYTSYKVNVEFLNGDKEEINFQGINTISYREMLEVYKSTKEDYKNISCKIKFEGISDSGELNIIFSKTINKTKEFEIVENERKLDDTKVEVLIEELQDIAEKLNKKRKMLSIKEVIANKNIEVELHHIEEDREFTDLEIREIFERLKTNRVERRFIKKEKAYIDMADNLWIIKNINRLGKSIYHKKLRDEDKANSNHYEKNYSIRYIEYNNLDEDRTRKLEDAKKIYDTVKDDIAQMRLICYNRVYKKNA